MLLEIPLIKIPNQDISINLNGQPCLLKLYTRGEYMYIDIYLRGILIYAGIRCANGSYLNQYTSDFKGYLFFFNDNELDPAWEEIGNTVHLLFADYDVLSAYFNYWIKNVYEPPILNATTDITDITRDVKLHFNITVTYLNEIIRLNPPRMSVVAAESDVTLVGGTGGYDITVNNPDIDSVTINISNSVFNQNFVYPVV